MVKAKLSRRQWAAAAIALPAAAASSAAAAAQTAPAPAAGDDLEQARQAVRRNREALGRFALPMGVEPAVRFEA